MVNGFQNLLVCAVENEVRLLFPLARVDSSFRWNDGGGVVVGKYAGNGKGVAGGVFYLHSRPVVIYGQDVLYAARGQDARSRPAKAGIQEGDDGMVNGFQDSPACAVENEVRLLFPLTRVDSSFRWNDGGGCGWEICREWQRSRGGVFYLHSRPVVIPAKAGIQEGDDGMVNRFQDSPVCAVENEVRLLFPLTRVDSSFRWNDGGGCGRKSAGDDKRVVGVSSIFISAPLSFMDRMSCMRREGRMPVAARRKPESRKAVTGWSMDSRVRLSAPWKTK